MSAAETTTRVAQCYSAEACHLAERLEHAAEILGWDFVPTTPAELRKVATSVETSAKLALEQANRALQIAEGFRALAALAEADA